MVAPDILSLEYIYTWVLISLVGSCDLLRVEKLKGMKDERMIADEGL